MPALLFGSISTLADTSELQRAAFNQAFAEHALDWHWSQDEYRTLLGSNGGAGRIAAYAQARGESVDAEAVHASKSRIFQQELASAQVQPRDGVVETIRDAKAAGYRLGFVTTTSAANIAALFGALAPQVKAADFDAVLSATDVEASKPDPAVYQRALSELKQDAAECVAVEDNAGGVTSAGAAGITCFAFPNENTAGTDLGPARVITRLDFGELQSSVGTAQR